LLFSYSVKKNTKCMFPPSIELGTLRA
jgi:hypothetical protein